MRRGSQATNSNNTSKKPITPTGPDMSLLEKMAVFEKGVQQTNNNTHNTLNSSSSTPYNYTAVGETGEKLVGSNIVMDRMAVFEKIG